MFWCEGFSDCESVSSTEGFGKLCGKHFIVRFSNLNVLPVAVFCLHVSFKTSTESLLNTSLSEMLLVSAKLIPIAAIFALFFASHPSSKILDFFSSKDLCKMYVFLVSVLRLIVLIVLCSHLLKNMISMKYLSRIGWSGDYWSLVDYCFLMQAPTKMYQCENGALFN